MGKSALIDRSALSPYHSGERLHPITRITPHCIVGQASLDRICEMFSKPGKNASCNYGIATDGRVAEIVPENMRAWTSSNADNDQRAVTIECASDNFPPYAYNEAVFYKLVKLCADICVRNNLRELLWIPDKDKALHYTLEEGQCLLTVHRWFAAKSCPGEWLMSCMGELADNVNAILADAYTPENVQPAEPEPEYLYHVQVGAYSVKANAEKMLVKLVNSGYPAYIKKERR